MPPQIDLALKEAPNGRPRYFIGKDETLQPKMRSNPSKLLTLPIGSSSRFIEKINFNPQTKWILKHLQAVI
jgi:hypothetical protein